MSPVAPVPLTAAVGSLDVSLAAWLLTPLLLFVVGYSLGLLTERLAGARLPDPLLVPVGFCAAVVLVMPGYRLGAGAWLAVALLVVAVVAGLVLAGPERRTRLSPGWPGVAGLAVFGLYLAPVLFAGGWTWSGYNFVNDTAVQFLLADHLASTGVTAPPGPPAQAPWSTGSEHVRIYLITGYPLGLHGLLATLATALPASIEAIYQPVIAATAAVGAMAAATLARALPLPAAVAALAGALALAANLTFNYGIQGNAKEIAALSAVLVAAAVGRVALTHAKPVGATAVVGLCLAAAVAFFSTAAVPYLAALAGALLVAAFVQRGSTLRARIVPAALAGTAVLVVASLSTLTTMIRFGEVAEGTFSADSPAADLGHLLRPLPLAQTLGIWLVGDYRFPQRNALVGGVLIALVAACLVAGVVIALRRRETGVLLALATFVVVVVVGGPRVSPYAEAKLLALASPALVLTAVCGAWLVLGRRRRSAAIVLVAVIAGGILFSDALAYRVTQLAPVERLEALEDVGKRYAGRGAVLVTETEEFAKYFMRDARHNVALELVTPKPARSALSESILPRAADIDQMSLDYVRQFPVIVPRRGPDVSRPPANYRLDHEDRFYRAWIREPRPTVTAHAPLQGLFSRGEDPACADLRRFADGAPGGGQVLASLLPEQVRLDPGRVRRPATWRPSKDVAETVRPSGPGVATAVRSFRGGRYEMWVMASTGRRLDVRVDGRRVGSVQGIDNLGSWQSAGRVALPAGRHRVDLVRPSGGVAPGDGATGLVGPLVLERVGAPRVAAVSPGAAARLCGRSYDWLETVEGRGS